MRHQKRNIHKKRNFYLVSITTVLLIVALSIVLSYIFYVNDFNSKAVFQKGITKDDANAQINLNTQFSTTTNVKTPYQITDKATISKTVSLKEDTFGQWITGNIQRPDGYADFRVHYVLLNATGQWNLTQYVKILQWATDNTAYIQSATGTSNGMNYAQPFIVKEKGIYTLLITVEKTTDNGNMWSIITGTSHTVNIG